MNYLDNNLWGFIMKGFCLLFVVLFCFNLTAQYTAYSTYPNFSELTGMEDYNNHTNLFYRINSYYHDIYSDQFFNDIYNFNISAGSDSLYLRDQSCYYLYMGDDIDEIMCYDIWNKDPKKLVYSTGIGGMDLDYSIRSYFEFYLFNAGIIPINFISTYKNNDTTFVFTFSNYLLKYKGRGTDQFGSTSYLFDTLGMFRAVSHNPYNNNIFFAVENYRLFKSNDEGRTKYLADTTTDHSVYSQSKSVKCIFYDKDQNYIFRIIPNYQDNKLMVSNNKGEFNSWQLKFNSINKIFISNDDSVSGLLYMGVGKNIHISTNYGNNFLILKTLDKNITGIYKKPGTDKLYVSTSFNIYEITGNNIIAIKTLPFEKDQLKYDPIQVGNKWVYNGKHSFTDTIDYSYMKVKEILKDTVCNNKQYKKIMYLSIYSDHNEIAYEYQRIDTNTGLVYKFNFNLNNDYVVDDLNIVLNDTINYSRYFTSFPVTVLKSIDVFTGFNSNTPQRNCTSFGVGVAGISYSLAKNFGLVYFRKVIEDAADFETIKGCYINGIVYGDTNRLVGVGNDASTLPLGYSLAQNYPNPFNPSTTIEYALPQSGKVTLRIYDLLGREVYQLVNEVKDAGKYKVQFNASGLSSGVYFYRLECGSFMQIKKLMILK